MQASRHDSTPEASLISLEVTWNEATSSILHLILHETFIPKFKQQTTEIPKHATKTRENASQLIQLPHIASQLDHCILISQQRKLPNGPSNHIPDLPSVQHDLPSLPSQCLSPTRHHHPAPARTPLSRHPRRRNSSWRTSKHRTRRRHPRTRWISAERNMEDIPGRRCLGC